MKSVAGAPCPLTFDQHHDSASPAKLNGLLARSCDGTGHVVTCLPPGRSSVCAPEWWYLTRSGVT